MKSWYVYYNDRTGVIVRKDFENEKEARKFAAKCDGRVWYE